MGKKKAAVPEQALVLPRLISPSVELIDTHLHLSSTFTTFRLKYPSSDLCTIQAFARKYLSEIHSVVDVWCEAPVDKALNDVLSIPDTDLPFRYRFVVGVHPHEAKSFDDDVELAIEKAAGHEKNVGIGEIGLDYHYDNSPREIQQAVLRRQLKLAVRLRKPLTIHTREADDDIYRILTEELPQDYTLHIHCYTDTLELAQKLLDHFPHCYFGITGVVTYSTNLNTTAVLKHMLSRAEAPRILLETDSPFMTPTNLPLADMGLKPSQRMPFCHSGMIPWTARWIADIFGGEWTADQIACPFLLDMNHEQLYSLGKRAGPLGTLYSRDSASPSKRSIDLSSREGGSSPGRSLLDAFRRTASPVRKQSATTDSSLAHDAFDLAGEPDSVFESPTSLRGESPRGQRGHSHRRRTLSNASSLSNISQSSPRKSAPSRPNRPRVSDTAFPSKRSLAQDHAKPPFVIYTSEEVDNSFDASAYLPQPLLHCSDDEESFDKENVSITSSPPDLSPQNSVVSPTPGSPFGRPSPLRMPIHAERDVLTPPPSDDHRDIFLSSEHHLRTPENNSSPVRERPESSSPLEVPVKRARYE